MTEENSKPQSVDQNVSPTRLKKGIEKIRSSVSHFYLGKIQPRLNMNTLSQAILKFDPQKSLDWLSKKVHDKGISFYGSVVTVILCTYFLSDITALLLGDYIPRQPSNLNQLSRYNSFNKPNRSINEYKPIFSRNLFNSKGLIPGDEESAPGVDSTATPVKTNLPFNLIGTLIMSNELHSIATIEDKSISAVYPVRVDDEIPGKAKIQKIESKRVIFINSMSGRREYVEIPEDLDSTKVATRNPNPNGMSGIEKLSPTQFNVSRNEVDKALSDFNKVLTDARAVPNSENGIPNGYKLFQIVPGSIYDKLGLQNGDVITGLNGQVINDPAKAFEMLNDLKTANHLELQLKKDGKPLNYVYDIRN